MFFIDPKVEPKFESLSSELQKTISEKGVQINNIYDLIKVLEEISSDTPEK